MHLTTIFILVLSYIISINSQDIKTLTTTLLSDNIAQGNYWNIVAFNDISIVLLEFNTNECAGTYVTRLWKRNSDGGYSGVENNKNEWTLVTQQEVGCNVTTPNSALNNLNIPISAGFTQGFLLYIERIDNTDTTVSLASGTEGQPLVANTDLAVLIGTIIEPGFPEFNRTQDTTGQQTNLIIFYVLGTLSPTLSPTIPTINPTLITNIPTINPTKRGTLPSRNPASPPVRPPVLYPTFSPFITRIPTRNGNGNKGKGKGYGVRERIRQGGVIPFGRPLGNTLGNINNGIIADGSVFRDNLQKLKDFMYSYSFNTNHARNYDGIYGGNGNKGRQE